MEELLIDTFGKYAIIAIPVLCGIASSFIIEGFNKATSDKVSGKVLTAIICLVMAVFIVFGFPNVITDWWNRVFIGLVSAGVTLVFYYIGGKTLVEFLIGNVIKRIRDKADK